ncbi:MAG: glycosyltransferase family 2 protein [Muribaculaceae bacterium]|nr:glycosyltransferase family 2 protein [Muribaculaceae bacterium]
MTKDDNILTVIIPVYNRAAILEQTLDSVAAQSLRPLNVVIVDNNSTDNSVEVIERWALSHADDKELHVDFTMELKPGAAAARNAGMAVATTPLIMFFDSDDEMYPTLAAEVVEAFKNSPEMDVLCWQSMIQLPEGNFRLSHRMSMKTPLSTHIIHCTLATQRWAARRSFIECIGGWNDGIRAWNDLEIGVRMLAARPIVKSLDGGPRVKTYFTPFSITQSNPTTRVNADLEHALNCCEENLAVARRHDAIRWIDFRRTLLAADYSRGGNKQAARRLMHSLVSPHRWIYRLLYWLHRLYPRGTHFFAPFHRC